MRIGIDFGRVIQGGADADGTEDTSFLGSTPLEAIHSPPNAYALDVIREIVQEAEDVWIISKCGTLVQAKTLAWLYANEFWRETGVRETHIRFCARRSDKAVIAQELGLTYFIDDRLECLTPMRGIVKSRIVFGPQRYPIPPQITHCLDWPEVLEHLGLTRR